ncbi:nucleotide exchange factor GrpE [Candidatus Bathyarchaeota archaeon]|nr:MAG: nucleotide exchange factor GrpE [Candidatus Bathyarchaeota archaeon]
MTYDDGKVKILSQQHKKRLKPHGKSRRRDDDQLKTLTDALNLEKKRSQEYLTRLKYMQADFENLKKRLEKQMKEVEARCNERLIVDLLEVVDELNVAVESGGSSNCSERIVQGVQMTLKKLRKLLEKEEVSPIESVGEPFDPSKHLATAKIVKKDVEEGKVVEEVRKGYIMKGKVIRPSIVKVSVKPSKLQQEMNTNE